MHGQDVKLPYAVLVLKVSVTYFQEPLSTADTEASLRTLYTKQSQNDIGIWIQVCRFLRHATIWKWLFLNYHVFQLFTPNYINIFYLIGLNLPWLRISGIMDKVLDKFSFKWNSFRDWRFNPLCEHSYYDFEIPIQISKFDRSILEFGKILLKKVWGYISRNIENNT